MVRSAESRLNSDLKPEFDLSESEESITRRATRPVKRKPRGRGSLTIHKWSRLIHVYTSMICLLIVLFFAVTGVTLNHPDWAFGGSGSRSTVHGTLPAKWKSNDGTVDWLVVDEYVRAQHGVHGLLSNHSNDDSQGNITFNGPSYQAAAQIDVKTGTYDLTVETQGVLALVNDLHKGRDTAKSWRWLIDVIGVALTVISLTGLALQFFLRKRRRSAFSTAAVGALIVAVLTWLTLR